MELVGRDEELASVRAFVSSIPTGPAALVITGDPGVGKTTLWRAGVDAARERSLTVLTASPAQAESKLAFAALGDLLGAVLAPLLPALPAPQRRALEVALLLRERGGRALDQRAVALAFVTALRALASSAAVLLAVDDIQWLDAPSTSALAFAVRRLRDEPIGLLLAQRLEGGDVLPLGLDRALPETRLARVALGGLSLGALHEVVRTRLGLALSRPALRQLHASSRGNPLFALEIARAVQRRGDGFTSAEPLLISEDLRQLVQESLAALPDATEAPLLAAAALSEPTLPVVQNATSTAEDWVASAVASKIIELDGDRIRFTHPLIPSVLYANADAELRRSVHARLAAAVSQPEERARHLALATEGPNAAVAGALDDAALAVAERGAPEMAAELCEQAYRLTPADRTDDLRRRLLTTTEYALSAGDTARASKLLEGAVEEWPPSRARVAALSRLARLHRFDANLSAAAELFRRAFVEAGDDRALLAEIEEGLAWSLVLGRTDLVSAVAHARAAVEHASSVGDRAALAQALSVQGVAEFLIGGERAISILERALEFEPSTEHLRVLRQPGFAYAYVLSRTDDVDLARARLGALLARATEHGDESSLPALRAHLSYIDCLAGRYASAATHAREGYEVAVHAGQRPPLASVLSVLALVEAQAGRPDAAREAAHRALSLAAAKDGASLNAPAALAGGAEFSLWALGVLELSCGEPAAAHRSLGPLTDAIIRAGVREPGELRFLPDAIEALVGIGKLERAETHLRYYEEAAATLGRTSAVAAASRCRGLILAARGEQAAALAALERALAAHDGSPFPFARARTLLAFGEVQRRAKQRREARASLRSAQAAFDALGAVLWSQRAAAELGRIGGRRPAVDLTATERRVASLVVEGRSNKEVAAALFVTTKTVEATLTRIYERLGVRSRAELMRRTLGERPGKE